MGYYCNKEIASVVEPSEIVLANNPNFVVFSSKSNTANRQKMKGCIEVLDTYTFVGTEWDARDNYSFKIVEKQTGTVYSYYGTYDKKKVSDTIYYIPSKSNLEGGRLLSQKEAINLIAQNIKECLFKNPFLENNFDISIGTELNQDGNIIENNTICIVAKGYDSHYQFELIDNGVSIGINHTTYKPHYQYAIDFYMISTDEDTVERMSWLNIKIAQGSRTIYERKWNGTLDPLKASDNTYLLIPIDTFETFGDSYRASMSNIVSVLKKDNTLLSYLDIVLGDYNCFVKSHNPDLKVEITGPHFSFNEVDISAVISSDTIDYGTGNYQIDLDVYTDHTIFPGSADVPSQMGNYLTTLTKSYFGKPLWFDLSTLLSKKVSYSSAFLAELDLDEKDSRFKLWSNAGTMTDYRFIAKRTDGVIHEPFFYSSPLYVLNGYSHTLNPINLERDESGDSYILDFSQDFYADEFTKVKPLTTNFTRTHIKGQKQYFNFIHKYHRITTASNQGNNLLPLIGLHYKIYTQSGVLIKTYTERGQPENNFNRVNTALLQLDRFLPMYNGKIVGRIEVFLCRWSNSKSSGINEPEVIISTPLSFRILPEVLNEVNDFAFLNQLGGWDTMNFGGGFSSEFKSVSATIYKTLQPDFTLQSEIESVATKSAQERMTVETSPITKESVEWLKQMSVSPAVYELRTKRYILIDDMTLKYNSTDDLYQVEMKYHYTDTFNTKL